jgi:hypothetical protein
VLIVALQLAATVRADRLARTLAFLGPLEERRPRAAAFVRAAYDLTGAAVMGGMAWATISVFSKDWASGEFIGTPGIGTLPTWPFRALILLGLTVAALEFLRRAALALRSSRAMSPIEIGGCAIGLLVVLIYLGMPIGVAMLASPSAAWRSSATRTWRCGCWARSPTTRFRNTSSRSCRCS